MVLSTSTPIASGGAGGRTFKPRTPRGTGFSGSRFGIERDEKKPVEAGKLVVVSADINYDPVPASVNDGNNNRVLNVSDDDVLAGTAADCYQALDGQWPSMMKMMVGIGANGGGAAGGGDDDDGSENGDTKRAAFRYADASRKQPETPANGVGALPCPSSSGVIIGKPVNLMLSKMSLLWNTSGWLRVYCGPDRSEISSEDRSRMIHVVTTATTLDVVKDMNLPGDYTLWVQTGGGRTRRLEENEYPLLVQEEFLRSLGYFDESRRARLGIDPELKHLIRFHIGPAEIPMCKGVLRSGTVEVLKGLVFPQWRRRHLAIVGSKLILYPGSASFPPEVYELAGANVFEHAPCDNRLVIKIVPKTSGSSSNSTSSSTRDSLDRGSSLASVDFIDGSGTLATVYPGSSARHAVANAGGTDSESTGETAVLFLGFRESWERDQWSIWLSVNGVSLTAQEGHWLPLGKVHLTCTTTERTQPMGMEWMACSVRSWLSRIAESGRKEANPS
ncbi:hypothetical protein AND_007595 [Anopheles darlingi]|uniref:PHLPP-like RA domain-containing protein n=1 Tax=Anopheles darlingi TaxID=43151 RepID=W5J9U1_ANODA|nr:hypothetical protein AND_007595 [Anopheles darlingi]